MTNRIAESRGIPEVQYYDGRVGGEVNKNYTNIVNVEPYKCPRYQQGVLEELQINPKEKGDKDFCFLKGRKGFKEVTIDNDFDGYEIIDSVELGSDHVEYYLAINYKKDKLKIGKKVNDTIVDISSAAYGFSSSGSFEFEKGLSEKITKTYFPGGKSRDIFTGSSQRVSTSGVKGWTQDVGYFLTDDSVTGSGNTFNNGSILPGDYIYLFDTGEVGQVTIIEEGKIRIDGVWRMDVSGTSPTDGPHKYMILSERVETFVFQTKGGPRCFHNLENSVVQIFPIGNLSGTNLKISSMVIQQDNLYFIDKKSGRLYYGGHGIQQFVIAADAYTYIGYKYNRLEKYQDYIVMYSKNSIGAAYGVWQEYEKDKSIYNIRWQDLYEKTGAWGEHAVKSFPGGIQLIGSDGLLYSLGIEATGSATGILKPSLSPQSYHIVDDIARLNKDSCVYLYINNMDISIFINNSRYPNGINDKNTKVLIYDYHHKFWYKWMIKGIHINNKTEGGYWFGDGVFKNVGDTDNGEDFNQIVSAVFGEGYALTGKFITMAKLLVGQNCIHTKGKSEIKIRFDNGGRSRCIRYDDIGSSDYVKNVMDRHNGGTILEGADGTEITTGNGVPGTTYASLNSVFDSYSTYESTMKTELGYDYTEDLAKWGKVKLEITAYADVLYLDIIARGKDNIDFGGFLMGFSQTDTDSERLNDTLGLEN